MPKSSIVFKLLREARNDLYIFPKIPLDQIISSKAWLSKETYKTLKNDSVDFLLAHPRFLGPLLVVSLKQLEYTNTADLLHQAGIRWISLDKARTYTTIELRDKISQALPKWQ